jgi:streptogramin lyase
MLRVRAFFACALVTVLSACAGSQQSLPSANVGASASMSQSPSRSSVIDDYTNEDPFMLYVAPANREVPQSGNDPLIVGPDQNFWYVGGPSIGIVRFTPQGASAQFTIPGFVMDPSYGDYVAVGTDGNMWYTYFTADGDCGYGSLTTSGSFLHQYTVSTTSCIGMMGPALAGTGIWFTSGQDVGYISSSGSATRFAIPASYCPCAPSAIALGPDGNLWFTMTTNQTNYIGRVTPAGAMTFFSVAPLSQLGQIIVGPDGKLLWFSAQNAAGNPVLVKMTTGGRIVDTYASQYSIDYMTVGADGNVWASNSGGGIERFTGNGDVRYFVLPNRDADFAPIGLVLGPDSNLWFTTYNAGGSSAGKGMGRFALPRF